MKLAPIVLFTYNRPDHTKRTIESLQNNIWADQSDLFIFSDAAKNGEDEMKVEQVRTYLSTVKQFRSVTIIEREFNYGLANNIVDGVTKIIAKHERLIVMEDDLLTSPFFLQYMNQALELYEKEDRVISIHGYIYPVRRDVPDTFFLIDPGSLGWATWKDRWEQYEVNGAMLLQTLQQKNLTYEFDYDNTYPFTKMLEDQVQGRNNSWAIRWYAYAILHRKLTLYPGRSLVFHIGNDGSGTNTGSSSEFDVELTKKPIPVDFIDVAVSEVGREAFKDYFRYSKSFLHRGLKKIKQIFYNVWDRK
jgi:hypothetical protein